MVLEKIDKKITRGENEKAFEKLIAGKTEGTDRVTTTKSHIERKRICELLFTKFNVCLNANKELNSIKICFEEIITNRFISNLKDHVLLCYYIT